MIVKVKIMNSLSPNKIRNVNIPIHEVNWDTMTLNDKLDAVFYWGQNDFQPQFQTPSVSVGDIILLNNNEYMVDFIGFLKKITTGYASGTIHIINNLLWLEI